MYQECAGRQYEHRVLCRTFWVRGDVDWAESGSVMSVDHREQTAHAALAWWSAYNQHYNVAIPSQYQKGKTRLDLLRQEMMGFWDAVASAGPYANNLHLALDRLPHQHLITLFLQAGCSSWHPLLWKRGRWMGIVVSSSSISRHYDIR